MTMTAAIRVPLAPRRPNAYHPQHEAGRGRNPVAWHVTMPGPYRSHRMSKERTPAPWIVTGLRNSRILADARRAEEEARALMFRRAVLDPQGFTEA